MLDKAEVHPLLGWIHPDDILPAVYTVHAMRGETLAVTPMDRLDAFPEIAGE